MELTDNIKEKLNKLKGKDLRLKIAFAAGIIGILLIFLSTLGEDEKKEKTVNNAEEIVTEDSSAYKKALESELKTLLESISGVGRVKVMLSIEGTTEYVYAEEVASDMDSSEDKTSESHENKVVIIENDGKNEALVKKVIRPQVTGVAVVCEGGGNLSIKETVINAVSTVLDISSSRICVYALGG